MQVQVQVQVDLVTMLLVATYAIQLTVSSPSDRIIFPGEKNYNICHFENRRSKTGTCKQLEDCQIAMDQLTFFGVEPKRCTTNQSYDFICCPKDFTFLDVADDEIKTVTKRRSEEECDKHYGIRIAVVNGEPTAPREFPYMVALGWHSNVFNDVRFQCGGVLISEKFVLTAAHCMESNGVSPTVVRLGGVNLTDTDVENIKIKKVFTHPDYNSKNDYNDVALIQLETDVDEMPACIWSEDKLPHDRVTTIGYGHTRFGGRSSDQLLKAALRVVANQECGKFYEGVLENGLSEKQVCAKDPAKLRDSCQGDSGGPIIMKVGEGQRAYVVGITSIGQGCAGEPPSIYTRASSYIDWIESIVWQTKPLASQNTMKTKEKVTDSRTSTSTSTQINKKNEPIKPSKPCSPVTPTLDVRVGGTGCTRSTTEKIYFLP